MVIAGHQVQSHLSKKLGIMHIKTFVLDYKFIYYYYILIYVSSKNYIAFPLIFYGVR